MNMEAFLVLVGVHHFWSTPILIQKSCPIGVNNMLLFFGLLQGLQKEDSVLQAHTKGCEVQHNGSPERHGVSLLPLKKPPKTETVDTDP